MVTKAAERQKRFRARQRHRGLVQVRTWVPKRHEQSYRAIAEVMRGKVSEGPPDPITPKQRYELKKLAKQRPYNPIARPIWECYWRAEAFLILNGWSKRK